MPGTAPKPSQYTVQAAVQVWKQLDPVNAESRASIWKQLEQLAIQFAEETASHPERASDVSRPMFSFFVDDLVVTYEVMHSIRTITLLGVSRQLPTSE